MHHKNARRDAIEVSCSASWRIGTGASRRSSGASACCGPAPLQRQSFSATCAAQAQQKSAPADFTGKQIRLFIGFRDPHWLRHLRRLLARYLATIFPAIRASFRKTARVPARSA